MVAAAFQRHPSSKSSGREAICGGNIKEVGMHRQRDFLLFVILATATATLIRTATPARNQCWPEGVPAVLAAIGIQMLQQPDQITIL
jgi:hypothetical protein